jgi:hypothetical protein
MRGVELAIQRTVKKVEDIARNAFNQKLPIETIQKLAGLSK